ncbi:hypothetical protein [Companilactobacillus nodensis]|uniref:hypothetical protein n=1 Tax=Companilactobacillus nodensis TaxID=460870 RepID=UPI00046856A4|nr:hypothetical protein [Companilactobacillus nodensis]
MRIKKLQIYLGIFVTVLIGLFSVLSKPLETTAATVPSVSDVLKAAPDGMNLNDYFEKPDNYSPGGGTTSNSAKVVTKGSSTPTDLIEMTSGANQICSVWGRMTDSNGKDYNYFDVTKDQTFSMWMYFSGSEGTSSDGMAFVIQNDDRGINAISTYSSLLSAVRQLVVKHLVSGVEMVQVQISLVLLLLLLLEQSRRVLQWSSIVI